MESDGFCDKIFITRVFAGWRFAGAAGIEDYYGKIKKITG